MEQNREESAVRTRDLDTAVLDTVTDELKTGNPYLSRLLQEAERIQGFLEEKADLNDAGALSVRLNEMDALMARASEMQVRAKAMREHARNSLTQANEGVLSKMSATNSARLLNCYLEDYLMTADRMDALYSTLSQSCRNLITQISLIKKQMELQGGVPRCL